MFVTVGSNTKKEKIDVAIVRHAKVQRHSTSATPANEGKHTSISYQFNSWLMVLNSVTFQVNIGSFHFH